MSFINNKKVKILHFCIADKIGGIEVFIKSIVENINVDEFEIGILSNTNEYVFRDYFESKNIPVYIMPSVKQYFKYKRFLKEIMNNYDIIHFHKNSASNILACNIAKKLGKKIIVHSHNTMPSSGKVTTILHKLNKNKLNKLADYKFACSNLAGNWLFNNNDFVIINNGIDINKFKFNDLIRNKLRKDYKISTDDIVIGHVGRFNEQKNHKFLITVLENLKKYSSYKLLLIGDGILENEVRSIVDEKELSGDVIFLGQVENICDYYNMMDVFVFPSLYEGFPISLVEVAANGLPAVISSSVTNETIINDNMHQLELTLGEESWAKYICKRKLELERLDNGHLNVEEKGYAFSSSMRIIEKIYKECVENE